MSRHNKELNVYHQIVLSYSNEEKARCLGATRTDIKYLLDLSIVYEKSAELSHFQKWTIMDNNVQIKKCISRSVA